MRLSFPGAATDLCDVATDKVTEEFVRLVPLDKGRLCSPLAQAIKALDIAAGKLSAKPGNVLMP
jgi:hypothetical protein